MGLPKISVIIPSFNQAQFIGETLKSVIAQNYPALELIVIDGGSEDGSADVIRQHEKHIAYWVSESDNGQTDALIKGFNRSTGEIQCWLNSDDQLLPGTLHQVAEYFEKHTDVDVVFGDTIWINVAGEEIRRQREIPFNRFIWMFTYNYMPGMSTFWRRSIYEAIGGLDPQFNLVMDADLWIRMSYAGKIGHVRNFWSYMRFYDEQKNRRLRDDSNREDMVIRSRYWGTERPPFMKVKRLTAQLIRTTWKLLTGCYYPGYVRNLENRPQV